MPNNTDINAFIRESIGLPVNAESAQAVAADPSKPATQDTRLQSDAVARDLLGRFKPTPRAQTTAEREAETREGNKVVNQYIHTRGMAHTIRLS